MKVNVSTSSWYLHPIFWIAGVVLVSIFSFLISWIVKPSQVNLPSNRVENLADIELLLVLQKQRNDALARNLETSKEHLESNICETFTAPSPNLQHDPANEEEHQTKALNRDSLLHHLEKGTVLVLNQNGTGSGFFITENTIVTNAHVVEGAINKRVRVTSRALGRVIDATIVHSSSGDIGGRDYAILKVDTDIAPTVFELSEEVSPLEVVTAGGYPGVYMDVWKQGGGEGIPPLTPRQGEVVHIQTFSEGIPLINHTADIFPGNSGGPLLDQCGRVVGINTFYVAKSVNANERISPLAKFDFAIGSKDLVNYLRSQGVSLQASNIQCD